MLKNNIRNLIEQIPDGYSLGIYQHKSYGITKSVFNNGKSYKVFAKELGGTNFISLNFYGLEQKDLLKPCEMPEQKVVHFLNHVKIVND